MSVVEFFHSTEPARLIAIVGEVSAGESFVPTDDHLPGAHPEHVTLSLGDSEQVALRVRGQSMAPVYRDGDVIIDTRLRGNSIAKALNRDCIIKTADGRGFVKVLRKGNRKGHYMLRSYDPSYEDIDDVEVEWVAPVLWVRRAL